MMRALVTAVAAFALTAGAAAAGPQGSGLALTEDVVREAAATVSVSHGDAACLGAAAQKLAAQPEVRKVAVRRSSLRVTYPSPALAAQGATAVRSAVDAACAAATPDAAGS